MIHDGLLIVINLDPMSLTFRGAYIDAAFLQIWTSLKASFSIAQALQNLIIRCLTILYLYHDNLLVP